MADDDKTLIAEISKLNFKTPTRKSSIPSLVQYSGEALGKRYLLSGETVKIGRSSEADITIVEASVSRLHAQIIENEDEIFIEDLGSANGTYINDQKVMGAAPLKDQDVVRLGTLLLKFFSSDNIDGYIQDKIYRMATIDAGTQIYNKQYLMDALVRHFQLSKGSGRELSIIYYDLDHFNKVNDTYGHNAGDQILRESAQLVKTIIRKEDIFGRFGGEEFIIVLPKTDIKTAYDLGERIRSICAKHVYNIETINDGIKKVVKHTQTFSLGVSQLTQNMTDFKELLESADKKLYNSKQNGRNKVTA